MFVIGAFLTLWPIELYIYFFLYFLALFSYFSLKLFSQPFFLTDFV